MPTTPNAEQVAAEIDWRDAEIERLRAALKPFADLGYSGLPNQQWIDDAKRLLYDQQSQQEKT